MEESECFTSLSLTSLSLKGEGKLLVKSDRTFTAVPFFGIAFFFQSLQ